MKVNVIYTPPRHKKLRHPREDYYEILSTPYHVIIAVADGVTRYKYEEGDKVGSLLASKTFCDEAIKYLQNMSLHLIDDYHKILENSFYIANKSIHELNKKLKKGKNYLEEDYYETTAILTVIDKRTYRAYVAQICDCGYAILTKTGRLEQMFPEEEIMKEMKSILKEKYGEEILRNREKRRTLLRLELRNKEEGYGTLTGEKGALKHVNVKSHEMRGKILLIYTDGVYYYLKDKKFLKSLHKHIIQSNYSKILQEFHDPRYSHIDFDEKTLVIVEF